MQQSLNVAVPWSLSHYIPLDGFRPLYRALFDHAPAHVTLFAWDNVKLHRRLHTNARIRGKVLSKAKSERLFADRFEGEPFTNAYHEFFWPPNQIMTAELKGNIEFHHTTPFPSLTRPFVFHCESLASLSSPFIQNGGGCPFELQEEMKVHFRDMFANPMCLGIFSHVPETLEAFRRFFSNPIIDRKLFHSRVGLSEEAVSGLDLRRNVVLPRSRFLFLSSASSNPSEFFRRGGHITLRFWERYLTEGRVGLLILACRKPSDQDLSAYGVDVSLVRAQTGRSIVWGADYLSDHEVNGLLASAHVLLMPSESLDSVLVMRAMKLGSIPVVIDAVGTSVYVTDNENGIILQGVRAAMVDTDAGTDGIQDRTGKLQGVDDSLVSQMATRIGALLERPQVYDAMRQRMMTYAHDQFSGKAFSESFWKTVSDLYHGNRGSFPGHGAAPVQTQIALQDCTMEGTDWARVFECPSQPTLKINTGLGTVWRLGGAMIHAYGSPHIERNDWSVLAQYYKSGAPRITFANTLEELAGKYLYTVEHREVVKPSLIEWITKILKPFPRLYRFGARVLSGLRCIFGAQLARPNGDPDVELVRHAVFGYNIIRRFDRYYAIPQNEGAFISVKAESGGYSSCFVGYSVEEVERAIVAAHDSLSHRIDTCAESTDRASLPVGSPRSQRVGTS